MTQAERRLGELLSERRLSLGAWDDPRLVVDNLKRALELCGLQLVVVEPIVGELQ